MKKQFLSIIISSLILLTSCASNKEIINNSSEELSHLPSWVINPNIDGNIAAVGIASRSRGGLRFQIPQAEADARANIAAQINTEVSRLTKDALRSASISGNEEVESVFSQVTKNIIKKIPLRGAKRINMYKDAQDGNLYIHMSLDNKMILNYLKENKKLFKQAIKANNMTRNHIDQAQEAVNELFTELNKELEN